MEGLLLGVSQVLLPCQLCSSCAEDHTSMFAGSGELGLDAASYPSGPGFAQGYYRGLLQARLEKRLA